MTRQDEAVREARAVAGSDRDAARNDHSFWAAAMGDPEASWAWNDPDRDHAEAADQGGRRRTRPSHSGTPTTPEFVTALPACEGHRDWGGLGPQLEPRDDDLSVDAVRDRTAHAIADAYRRHDRVLVDALPGTGKTFGAFVAAADRGEPVTYLAPRTDLYEQAREYARENGLSSWTLPSATRDCPTFTGEHGDDEADRVQRLVYGRGLTPKAVHDALDLPCEAGDLTCPYRAKWRGFDPDDFDVIIGHFKHGHLPPVVSGRHVVVDEWPGETFWTSLTGDTLRAAVDAYCARHADDEGWPFAGYRDALGRRDDADAREAARAWFAANPPDVDARAVLEEPGYHAFAPHATYAAVFATLGDDDYPLGRAGVPDADGTTRTAVFSDADGDPYSTDRVDIQDAPSLEYANAVVGLDGTPTPDGTEWRLALGARLNVRRVLGDAERREYLRDTLGISGVTTTDAVKPYSSGNWVTADRDAALFEGVADQYGPPVVLTTKAARHQYEAAGLEADDGHAAALDHYGNLRGTNRYAEERVAIVSGSTHYGDAWLRRWAAMNGDTVHPEGRGTDRDYGPADPFVHAMREAQVAQAALRVGRDGHGAIVVFNTAAVPEWFPVSARGYVARVWTNDQRDVHTAVRDLADTADEFTTADVADHPAVTCSRRTVLRTMHTLADQGVVDVRVAGRDYVWWPDGLHRLNDRGDVELPPLRLDDLEDASDGAPTISYMPVVGVRPVDDREGEAAAVDGAESAPDPGGGVADPG